MSSRLLPGQCVHPRMYSESGLETAVFQGRSSSHEHESIIIFYGLNDTLGKGREGKGREGKGREGKGSGVKTVHLHHFHSTLVSLLPFPPSFSFLSPSSPSLSSHAPLPSSPPPLPSHPLPPCLYGSATIRLTRLALRRWTGWHGNLTQLL